MMSTLFLNLPADDKITRRYMCSYQSPTSLFPPLELLSLAAVYKKCVDKNPYFIDAIAENKNTTQVIDYIKTNHIDLVVVLVGFECFEEDLQGIHDIKTHCPNILIVAFGHYPTLYAEEILNNSSIDIIIKGEPEEQMVNFLQQPNQELYHHKKTILSNDTAKGVFQNRIKNYNELPFPGHDLVNYQYYHEPMMASPFAMIQSARGCPYSCNYCVKSFGSLLTLKTPESIIEEMLLLKQQYSIKAIRFIDDTFTINKKRVLAICQLMIDTHIDIEWSCLSRTDNVDAEILQLMKKAGCKRIYYGIENASQRILDAYDKNINAEDALKAVIATNEAGIETAGFFMLGLPDENEDDFLKNKIFVQKANFDYIGIGGLVLYPGTELFDRYKDHVEFSLFPYINRFKDEALQQRYLKWNKELYNTYIFSFNGLKKNISKAITQPHNTFNTLAHALHYQAKYNRGVFHHIQHHKKQLNYG